MKKLIRSGSSIFPRSNDSSTSLPTHTSLTQNIVNSQ